MLGELEYDELYYPKDQVINLNLSGGVINSSSLGGNITGDIDEITKSQYFPVTAHVLVFFFVVLVSIVIMNLLFGLAVTDVQVRLSS